MPLSLGGNNFLLRQHHRILALLAKPLLRQLVYQLQQQKNKAVALVAHRSERTPRDYFV